MTGDPALARSGQGFVLDFVTNTQLLLVYFIQKLMCDCKIQLMAGRRRAESDGLAGLSVLAHSDFSTLSGIRETGRNDGVVTSSRMRLVSVNVSHSENFQNTPE